MKDTYKGAGRYIPYLILFSFIMLAFWQVSFMRYSIQWDAADQYYPWRYFLGECVRNGHLPLWNPYELCGYPFYADPQSGAWYPPALVAACFARYTIYLVQAEFIVTIFIGSAGMYKLARSMGQNSHAALFAALCFGGCGFFVSNAEQLTWYISAAWLTCLFWAYNRLTQSRKTGYALLCGLFFYLMISGGYPGFVIVAAYLLLLFFVLALFTAPDRTARITLFRLHLIFGVAVLLLGSPVFIAFAQSAHYYTRGAGITLDRAQFSPFTPQSAISFILPFATTKDMAFYKTDVSMSNAYFGLTGLIFLLASCTLPRSRKQWLIFALALGCMLVSFGPYLPFRKWLYNYVPLMNMFRFPSIFRLFFLVGFITLAAGAFGKVLAERERYLPRIKVITALLLALFLGILAWQRYKNNFYFDHYLFLHDINKFIEQSQHYQHIVLQSAIQIVVLLAFLLLASLRKGRYFTAPAILLLCMADLFMAAQLNARRTVVSANPAPEMYRVVKDMPAGLPVPDNTMNIAGINDNSYPGMRPMILNLNIFQKRVATDGYDPFLLKTYDSLTRSVIRDSVWANPYMYFADRMVCRTLQDSALTTHNTLAVNAADYARLKDQTFEHHPNDKIEVTSFGPGYAMANTHTEGMALLTLQQADYPGWQVTIDEGAAHYFTSNYCNMTVVVPKGDHRVAFRFRPPYITAAALVSLLTLAGIAVALILFRKKAFGSP